jgi:membrane protease YdiL (CAAX protease family)
LAATPEVGTVSGRQHFVVALVLAVGTASLAATLRVPAASGRFTGLGLLSAVIWTAGAFLAGGVPLRPRPPLTVATVAWPAALLGVVALGGFVIADLTVRHLPVMSDALDTILGKADAGPRGVVLLVALANALGEEMFFRGALHTACGRRRPGTWATLLYVAVTAATLNPALVLAAAVMGPLFTLERLSSASVAASTVTHISWSVLMVLALPR